MEISHNAPSSVEAAFEKLFADHIDLSDFIFKKSGAGASGMSLMKLMEMTRAGTVRQNDPPTLWMRRFLEALKSEIHECEESVPWKWWRPAKMDVQNVRVELIDAFHFLISAAVASGMTGSDFIKVYYQKRRVNYDRQIRGFTANDNDAIGV